jgi:hypothetical protein
MLSTQDTITNTVVSRKIPPLTNEIKLDIPANFV